MCVIETKIENGLNFCLLGGGVGNFGVKWLWVGNEYFFSEFRCYGKIILLDYFIWYIVK